MAWQAAHESDGGRVTRAGVVVQCVALTFAFVFAAPSHAADRVVEATEQPAPLVTAARANDTAAIKSLLDANPRPDVNQHSSDGTTALHWAVYHNDVALIERLLSAGANVKAMNDYGATPMSEAAVVGNV